MKPKFELLAFSTNSAFVRQAVAAGVQGIVVDWEHVGKEERQAFADTQINRDTLDDLRRVRHCTDVQVVCRVNSFGAGTAEEVEQAIEVGANEILLPMVRRTEEVQAVLEKVRGRCGVGILVETVAATRLVEELGRLPLSRVYVGLNDLAIERRTPNIFTAVADGTVEDIRRAFHVPFGFAGLTLPECGYPIPCRLLIGELLRLKCDFSFLRRSFHRDMRGRDLATEIPRLLWSLDRARLRTPHQVAQDRHELEMAIQGRADTVKLQEELFSHGKPRG